VLIGQEATSVRVRTPAQATNGGGDERGRWGWEGEESEPAVLTGISFSMRERGHGCGPNMGRMGAVGWFTMRQPSVAMKY
jgi:hypothetical protein